MEKNKIRNKKIIIALCIAVILIAVLSIAVFQKNNIDAIISFIRYSDEEIEHQIADNEETSLNALNELSEFSIRPITAEEQQALSDGRLTPEELADRLINAFDKSHKAKTPDSESQTAADKNTKAEEEKREKNAECDRQVSAIVARVYALKGQYTGALGGLESQARAEFNSLPPEKRNLSGAAGMLSGYIARGTALEHECDGKMDGILSELESVLRANGRDTSLVGTVASSYAREKSLKKAYYMSMIR